MPVTSFLLLVANATMCNGPFQQPPLPSQRQESKDRPSKQDETKLARTRCSVVFMNSKKGIVTESPLTLFLTKNGNVRTTGSRGHQKDKEEIIKYILLDSDKLFSNKPIEVVLCIEDITTVDTLKKFIDNIVNGLPDNKEVILYVDLLGFK